MAISKDTANSSFGKRLMELIEDKDRTEKPEERIKNIKGLATKFYELKLVKVSEKKTFDDPIHIRNNRINSIEKKILMHVNTGIITDKHGDYLVAYCNFFNCSSDYLLGFSDIKSQDMSIRTICEMTGLGEKAVMRLIRENKGSGRDNNLIWSKMLESYIFYAVAKDWLTIAKAYEDKVVQEGEIAYITYYKNHVRGKDLMELGLDLEGAEGRRDYCDAAFYGTLSKMTKTISDYVEGEVIGALDIYRKTVEKRFIEQAKKGLKEHTGYYPCVYEEDESIE